MKLIIASVVTYILVAVHAKRLHAHHSRLVIALDEISNVLELRLVRVGVGVGRHVVKVLEDWIVTQRIAK